MSELAPIKLRFSTFEIDEADAGLFDAGRRVAVTPKAFDVLCALTRRPGQLVTKGDLLDAVWGHQHVSESVLKTLVSELRAALGDDARQPRYIETAARRGYRFIGASAAAEPAPAAPGSVGGTGPASSSARTAAAPGTTFASLPPSLSTAAAATPADLAAPQCIGRRAELDRLHAAWSAVGRGARRLVWVMGEAGIGKTTLVDRWLAELPGARIARGQCVEQFGPGEPYLPVLEALSSRCRVDPSLAASIREVAPSWLAQMPWLTTAADRAALQRELAGSHPDRMLREMAELLDRHAASEPLLLVIEDLHWADHATIRLADYLARSRGPARLLWLGTFRPADAIAADHPLALMRHEWRARSISDEVALDPFSEREVGDYLEQRFAGRGEVPSVAAFARSLHAGTEGLPLFVASVVDDLVAHGLPEDGGAAVAGAVPQVPASVTGVIERRLRTLSTDDRALLEAASVCGVEFDCAVVGAALDRDAADVADRCEALVRGEQWLRAVDLRRRADGTLDSRLRFRHALHRHVLQERIGAQAKARLHRRIGAALQANAAAGDPVSPAEIALHFDLGREPMPAVRHYTLAVESALSRLAPVEAEALIERALVLLATCPPGDERDQLELVLSARRGITCPLLAGFGSAEATAAFLRAGALCDALPPSAERAWVITGLGWVSFSRGDHAGGLTAAERSLAIGVADDAPAIVAPACDLAAYCLVHLGRLEAARGIVAQGLAACERVPGGVFPRSLMRMHVPEVSLRAIANIPLGRLGLVEQAVSEVGVAHVRALASRDPITELLACWAGAIAQARVDAVDAVEAWALAMERLHCDRQALTAEAPSLWFRGWVRTRRADAAGGLELILQGIARHQQLGRLAGITQPLTFAAEAARRTGRLDDAQTLIERGFEQADRLAEHVYRPELWLERARLEAARGRAEAAAAARLEALDLARGQGALWVELACLVELCEAAADEDAQAHRTGLRAARDRLHEGLRTPLAGRIDALLASAGPGESKDLSRRR